MVLVWTLFTTLLTPISRMKLKYEMSLILGVRDDQFFSLYILFLYYSSFFYNSIKMQSKHEGRTLFSRISLFVFCF